MDRATALVTGVMALASWGAVVAAAAHGAQGVTTSDGVYTAAQATAGQALYGRACETCHQAAKFTGAEFTRAYVGRPLSQIDHAMAEMPQDNPGTLTEDDVAALIAYFLQLNHYPAGETPLSGAPAVLKSIMVSPRP